METGTCKVLNNRIKPLAYPVVFLFVLIFSAQSSFAQKWEFGVGAGSMLYKGEVSYNFNPTYVRPYFAVLGRYNFSHTMVMKVDMGIGNIKAQGRNSNDILIQNLQDPVDFDVQIWEATIGAEYNFLDFRKYKSHTLGTPYLTGGLGVFTYDVFNRFEGQAKPGVELCIPFGIGYKYVLSRHWNVGIEFGARKTFTGLLDGVHDTRPANYGNQKTQSQRGYYDSDDWYSSSKLTLTYTIYRVDCPFEVPTHH